MEATKKTYAFAGFSEKCCYCMDVYTPTEPRPDRACVIALHGGGFTKGSRDDKWSTRTAQALTQKGFIVICPDYRLGMQDALMENEGSSRQLQYCIDLALEDLGKVISYLWLHEHDLQIDMDKVILVGCSAGAIIALQYEYLRANQRSSKAKRYCFMMPDSWKPVAIAAYSGAILAEHFKFGYDGRSVPTLFFHGMKDEFISPRRSTYSLGKSLFGSQKLYKKISKWASDVCWLFQVEGAGHGVADILPETVDIFCSFVEHALTGNFSHMKVKIRDVRAPLRREGDS